MKQQSIVYFTTKYKQASWAYRNRCNISSFSSIP